MDAFAKHIMGGFGKCTGAVVLAIFCLQVVFLQVVLWEPPAFAGILEKSKKEGKKAAKGAKKGAKDTQKAGGKALQDAQKAGGKALRDTQKASEKALQDTLKAGGKALQVPGMAISVLGGGGPGNAEGDLDEETGDGGDQGQGGDGGDQGQGGDGDDQGQGDGSDSTSGGSGGSGLSSEEPKKAADFSLGSTEPSIQGDDKSVYDKLGITGLALPEGATGRENPETATPQGEEGENMPEK